MTCWLADQGVKVVDTMQRVMLLVTRTRDGSLVGGCVVMAQEGGQCGWRRERFTFCALGWLLFGRNFVEARRRLLE
jgi:hypothetical protein